MKRWLVLVGIAATLALGITVTLPPQVASASISPLAPDPINILPSVVKAGTKGNAAQTYAMWNSIMINVLQQAQKSPQFWNTASAVKGGTATVTEAQWLATQLGKIKVPAFKPQTLAKGVGTAGAVLFAFDAGFTIGDLGLSLLGIDKTGMVCEASRSTGEWLAFLGGSDCTEFKKSDELVANQGLVPGLTGGVSCNAAGRCIKLEKQGKNITYSGTVYSSYCFSISGGVETTAGRMRTQNVAGLQFFAPGGSDYGDFTALCSLPRFTANQMYLLYEQSLGALIQYQIGNNPTGAPQIPEAKDMNPSRTFKCVVTGSNGVNYTASTAPFKETDTNIPQPVCPDLPPGVFPEHIKITEEGGGETHIIYEEDATPESKGWNATYPECADGTCMLDLLKNGKSCFVAPAACLEWFDDPAKADTYQCRYGGKVVSLSECNVYGPSFNGDPKVTGHPDTGKPFGNPKPDPKDPKNFNTPVQDPTKARQCFPTGWGVLNPVEWVTKPVQCALEWAFVPRPSKVNEAFGNVSQRFANKMPMQLATLVAAWDFQPPPSGCNGILLDVFFFPQPVRVMNACPGQPLAVLADMSRIAGNLGFTLFGVVAISRHVARIFEFPGLGSSDS